MNNKVSIITPLFNSGRFISETIESVLNQTYQNWEMIIVDDKSSDNGVEIVKAYVQKDTRITLLENKFNSGAAISRNNGIEHAEGRFIAFLDSDDLWLPEKLEIQVEYMLKNNYPFTFTSYTKIDESGVFKGTHVVNKDVSYRDILKTCSIGCLTAVYDASQIGKVYMPDIRKRQDFSLWLKILKITPKAYAISEVLAKYRLRESSISSSKRKVLSYQWKVYRDIEKLSLLKSSYYFTCYAIYGVWNTYFKK
jgi:teichuronic acid biosynthesis glycosyltransferase TuaG